MAAIRDSDLPSRLDALRRLRRARDIQARAFESVTGVELMQRSGLEPDPWQVKFLQERPRRCLINCSRQSGKSTMIAAGVIHQALEKAGSLILLVGPAQRQAILLLNTVRQFAYALDPPVPMARVSEMSLHLRNGSRIYSLPGQNESIRGFAGVDLLVIDEAAFVPNRLAEAVSPMLAVSGGRRWCASTPHGKRGWWYEAWISKSSQWERILITADDCPRIPQWFLEEEREAKRHSSFMQEYYCSFEEAEGAVFSAHTIEAAVNNTMVSEW
jgi:hypothetical protein